ncbi:hypothetical protein PMAYCL1PPCAC_30141, partial [Pristionchus mayeri]
LYTVILPVTLRNNESAFLEMSQVERLACLILGIISIFLNSFVILALLRYRRRMLKNVFYVIVLNCAILDLTRAFLLTGVGGLQVFFSLRVTWVFTTWVRMKFLLKPLNLMTIFNLLVFTTNEFVVIRYPLHYRRYCRRRVILSVILACTCGVPTGISLGSHWETFTRDIIAAGENMIALLCYVCLVCYGFILRTIRKFHRAEQNGEFIAEGQKINHRATMKPCEGCSECQEPLRRCNSHRKWRSHLMSRHKYLIVIGTVLLVNVLFLIPYSGIQILHFLHVKEVIRLTMMSRFLQHLATVMIGVHAVCQPLCYFRMTEFRRLACCHGRAPWNRNKSFSHHKSFAVTRTQLREDDVDCTDHLMIEPKPRQPLLENARMIMAPVNPKWGANAVKFRARGNQLVKIDGKAEKRKSLLRCRSEADLLPPKKKSSAIEMALP